jgi:hypothetical protein
MQRSSQAQQLWPNPARALSEEDHLQVTAPQMNPAQPDEAARCSRQSAADGGKTSIPACSVSNKAETERIESYG